MTVANSRQCRIGVIRNRRKRAVEDARPYAFYRGEIRVVGAFCERPRANTVRPYEVTIRWYEENSLSHGYAVPAPSRGSLLTLD